MPNIPIQIGPIAAGESDGLRIAVVGCPLARFDGDDADLYLETLFAGDDAQILRALTAGLQARGERLYPEGVAIPIATKQDALRWLLRQIAAAAA